MTKGFRRFMIVLPLGALVLLAAVLLFVCWPSSLYAGYYSAINSNRAPVNQEEFVRDVVLAEDGSGRLSLCDRSGVSVDVIEFSSYRIRGNTVTFGNARPYGSAEGRGLTKEADGTYSLSFSFSQKEGGFVLGDCHYQRMEE